MRQARCRVVMGRKICPQIAEEMLPTKTGVIFKCPKGHTFNVSNDELSWVGPDSEIIEREVKPSVPPPRARTSDVETSHQAAASMVNGAVSQHAAILKALNENGPMTGDGLDEHFGWKAASANRRLPELREAGAVVMTADTAKTRSGRNARLWRAETTA